MTAKIKIGALISGGGTNLQAIIDACETGHIDGEIVLVGSDTTDAGGLERARRHKISTFVVDYSAIISRHRNHPSATDAPADFDLQEVLGKQGLFGPDADPHRLESFFVTRAVAEARLLEQMQSHSLDLLVLCGFMRNLTPYFIDRFTPDSNRPNIMNIHPALLPAFPGIDGYGDTFRYGCKVGGCTVHFIDYGEDTGPIIGQSAFPITEDDDLNTVRQKGLALEWQLYPECIQYFAQGRLTMVTTTHASGKYRPLQRRVVKVTMDR